MPNWRKHWNRLVVAESRKKENWQIRNVWNKTGKCKNWPNNQKSTCSGWKWEKWKMTNIKYKWNWYMPNWGGKSEIHLRQQKVENCEKDWQILKVNKTENAKLTKTLELTCGDRKSKKRKLTNMKCMKQNWKMPNWLKNPKSKCGDRKSKC